MVGDKLAFKRLFVGEGADDLKPDIVARETERITRYYKIKLDKGITSPNIKSTRDILLSVNNTVKKAITGYNRAVTKDTPENTFIARIAFLTKYNKMPEIWGNVAPKEEPKKKPVQPTEEVMLTKEDGILEPDFLTFADQFEEEYYLRRKKYYKTEFEFNESSDQVLLEAVLADEVLLRRFTNSRMNGEIVNDKLIGDINKRLVDNLRALGVSRQQRIADDTNQKGNVAQLADALETKLENIANLKDVTKREMIINKILERFTLVNVQDVYNIIEELEFMRQRSLREDMETLVPIPTINSMPEAAEIDSILRDMNKKELN